MRQSRQVGPLNPAILTGEFAAQIAVAPCREAIYIVDIYVEDRHEDSETIQERR